jgi:hypothetical protein
VYAEGPAIDACVLLTLLGIRTLLVVVDPAKPGDALPDEWCPAAPAPQLTKCKKEQRTHAISVEEQQLATARSGSGSSVVHMLLSGVHYMLLYPNTGRWAVTGTCIRQGPMTGSD